MVKKYILVMEFLIFFACISYFLWEFYFSSERILSFTSVVNRDGGIFGNVRFKWQLEVLSKLLSQPMGGIRIDDYEPNLAHNFWLDIAKDAGVIPFFLLVLFLVISAFDSYILIAKCKPRDASCVFLPMIFLSYTFYNAIEPTIYSVLMYLPLYYMTSAAMRAVNVLEKNGVKNVGRSIMM